MEPQDIADEIIAGDREGGKDEWGREMWRLINEHDDEELNGFLHRRIITTLGAYVTSVNASNERRKQNKRLLSRGVSTATSRPVTPTLSVRRDNGTRQAALWTEVSPRQYMEAVFREQRVVQGRFDSNAIRMQVAELIRDDEHLMSLSTLDAVCAELNVDPDTLGLADLEAS